ncbi:MAG: transcription-repair coupling factor [Syntrophobacterales bacterium]|nr:transcription-repair coupling factor [Syntrophobacterales bacterium]
MLSSDLHLSIHRQPVSGEGIQRLISLLSEGNQSVSVHRINRPAFAYMVGYIASKFPKISIVVVAPNDNEAKKVYRELAFFMGVDHLSRAKRDPFEDKLLIFPSRGYGKKPLEDAFSSKSDRLRVLTRLVWSSDPTVLVTSAPALLDRLPPRWVIEEHTLHIRKGDLIPEDLTEKLLSWGYMEVKLVEVVGDFSVRRDIVDCFIPLYPFPVRIELWGREVESLRLFNPISQRSFSDLDEILIVPNSELVLDKEVKKRLEQRLLEDLQQGLLDPSYVTKWIKSIEGGDLGEWERFIGIAYERTELLYDYLPPKVLWAWLETDRAFDEMVNRYKESLNSTKPKTDQWIQPVERWLEHPDTIMNRLRKEWALWSDDFRSLIGPSRDDIPVIILEAQNLMGFRDEIISGEEKQPFSFMEGLARKISTWQEKSLRVAIVCSYPHQGERLRNMLEHYGVPAKVIPEAFSYSDIEEWDRGSLRQVLIFIGNLEEGFYLPHEHLAILSERELFGVSTSRKVRRSIKGLYLSSFQDLSEGDFVVHLHHGIGIYRGLTHVRVGDTEGDFLVIEYEGGDRLYVPVDKLRRVQKYIGSEEGPPRIDRLGSNRWETLKKKARESAERVAEELLKIYALRQVKEGHAFSPPDDLYREFEATFPFEETPDQLRAIEDVLSDMMLPKPMDRLVCGDVGFGKTEVALRAAFKAFLDHKQVAVLVPTTVLAEQHYRTFSERFSRFDAKVEMLSRFRSPAHQRRIIEALKEGKIDIVIGTHRLLQDDVKFANLGLLIIDEEHRFGVKHKERLKQLRVSVDVLTLTATPIPRTLHMALSGVRDMSLIETPPADRKAIETYLIEFDETTIREVILRELNRGGQVFFVHNMVQNIGAVAERIREMVPEARVAVAHGQMPERELEKVMLNFVRQEIDVLVCTTIIESGLDIPSANTIIINDAHRLGLAQMYQIRGRVGRSGEQAYAYLIVPGEHLISEEARKRLRTLVDFSNLGSGFKIALNDLQIRGGGSILGSAQSGHIEAVGYELYLELIQEMIKKLKNEDIEDKEDYDPEIKISASAFIPEGYIPDARQRLVAYKRLASATTGDEINEIMKEWRDRYGSLPPETRLLLLMAKIRLLMRKLRILRVESSQEGWKLTFLSQEEASQAIEIFTSKGIVALTSSDSGVVIVPVRESDVFDRLVVLKKYLSRCIGS